MAEAQVQCGKCGKAGDPITDPLFMGRLESEIKSKVCKSCWKEWEGMKVMVINEYQVNLGEESGRELVKKQMRSFLNLGEKGAHPLGDLVPLVLVDVAQLESEGDVVSDRPVRQKCHELEYHADLLRAQLAQTLRIQAADVHPTDQNVSGRRLDQTVDEADQRGLTASREAHDAEALAPRHLKGGVSDSDDALEPLTDLGFTKPFLADGGQCPVSLVSEDLPKVLALDNNLVHLTFPRHSVG